MSASPALPQPPERVLSTLNADGSRRRIRPRPSPGSWWRRRRAVGIALMILFAVLPYLRLAGKPVILLDLPRREFTLFGVTFLSTDMTLFMLLMLAILIGIFLVTALFGRVWCGWGCPQTVYMEFLFRPIERWIEGGRRGSLKMDRRGGVHPRRILKLAVYAVLATFLAHTFLAYFVGVETLAQWVRRSPVEHPLTFFIMLGVTAMVFLDFAWFREQTCLVACPYGRLQSVLLDRRSLIVGYDARRGEPRAKGIKERDAAAGDCIDCGLCVLTCPTGIDIRDGLQMECIHCTQCADACDAVMERIGKPRGLIRYSSSDRLAGRTSSMLRPRVILYPLALALAAGLFGFALAGRADSEVTLLGGLGAPYLVAQDGRIANPVRLRIANRGREPRRYRIALDGPAEARLIAPINPFPVAGGGRATATVFIELPEEAFEHGERVVTLHVDDGARFAFAAPWPLVGPENEPKREAGDAHGSER